MFASTYTPPLTGVKQAPGTVADPEMLAAAANAFEKMYPGIKINFVPGAREFGTGQWYVSEAAAGNSARRFLGARLLCQCHLTEGLFQNLIAGVQETQPVHPGEHEVDQHDEPGMPCGSIPCPGTRRARRAYSW